MSRHNDALKHADETVRDAVTAITRTIDVLRDEIDYVRGEAYKAGQEDANGNPSPEDRDLAKELELIEAEAANAEAQLGNLRGAVLNFLVALSGPLAGIPVYVEGRRLVEPYALSGPWRDLLDALNPPSGASR